MLNACATCHSHIDAKYLISSFAHDIPPPFMCEHETGKSFPPDDVSGVCEGGRTNEEASLRGIMKCVIKTVENNQMILFQFHSNKRVDSQERVRERATEVGMECWRYLLI